MPQKAAGTRRPPPVSLPSPNGEPPAAIRAASPPQLPPGERLALCGVARLTNYRIFRIGSATSGWAIGFGQEDCPGLLHPCNDCRVCARNLSLADSDIQLALQASRFESILDSERQTMQGAELLAPRLFLVRQPSLLKRVLGNHGHGVQPGIDRLESLLKGRDNLLRGQFAIVDRTNQLGGRSETDILHLHYTTAVGFQHQPDTNSWPSFVLTVRPTQELWAQRAGKVHLRATAP